MVSKVWTGVCPETQKTKRPTGATRGILMKGFVTIQGERQYLWWAVDQHGDVIDILVQRRRTQRAAEQFSRRLLKGQRHKRR